MALTKISRGLLNTGVSDSSDATAITISSTEDVTLANHLVIGDDKELRLGDSSDVTFKHHNSGYGHLQNTGQLYIDAETISLRTDNSSIGERVTITAGGNVGIGTASPGYTLDVVGASGTMSRIQSAGSNTYLAITNSSNTSYIGNNGSALEFFYSGSKAGQWDAHGLKFGTDTAATNALDDYEEGTWTPTIASGGSVTATSARYTKIGDTVRATARLSSFSFTSVDGTALQIGGLPYSMHSDSNTGFAWGDTGTQGKAVYFWSGSGGGSNLYAYWSGSGYDSVTHNEVPSGFNLILNLVYGHG
tara:strand:- start:1493 stop:2404 length:912 start_codon:yes stop_codon:yes gene_type:complete